MIKPSILTKNSFLVVFLMGLVALTSCTRKKAELGSESNPVKLFFIPSVEAKMLDDKSKVFKEYLEKNTPYKFKVSVPQNYVAVVEAFGTDRADVAALNTFGYLMANSKYGAQARITVVRFGSDTYKGQIITRADGPIKKIEDITGKKFAYVDPVSTSGYLLPAKLFQDKGIKPKETVFANKHDIVVTMVYQGRVDAGATFHSPVEEGEIQDARRLVKQQFPNVEKEISILELTDAIPNDPIVFRKDMSEEMKATITKALLTFVETPDGKSAFKELYGVTALKESNDASYDSVRQMMMALGKDVAELMGQK
jgi:phosphonate transport system substrate-binding protein